MVQLLQFDTNLSFNFVLRQHLVCHMFASHSISEQGPCNKSCSSLTQFPSALQNQPPKSDASQGFLAGYIFLSFLAKQKGLIFRQLPSYYHFLKIIDPFCSLFSWSHLLMVFYTVLRTRAVFLKSEIPVYSEGSRSRCTSHLKVCHKLERSSTITPDFKSCAISALGESTGETAVLPPPGFKQLPEAPDKCQTRRSPVLPCQHTS